MNAVLNINLPCHSRFHPYVGAGIGGAVVSISNANAQQISPPEPGVNHFNTNPSDSDSAFAAQAKLGLSFDICRKISMFAEYRWLYLSSTDYQFGSTVFPGHPATSNWLVDFDHQHYNIGRQNVMQLAAAYEEQNANSEFKATAWLSGLNFCCPQNTVRNPAINPSSQPVRTEFFSSLVRVDSDDEEVTTILGKRSSIAEQILDVHLEIGL